jgi:hypothetical protein
MSLDSCSSVACGARETRATHTKTAARIAALQAYFPPAPGLSIIFTTIHSFQKRRKRRKEKKRLKMKRKKEILNHFFGLSLAPLHRFMINNKVHLLRSLTFIGCSTHHSFSVTFYTVGFHLFYSTVIKSLPDNPVISRGRRTPWYHLNELVIHEIRKNVSAI